MTSLITIYGICPFSNRLLETELTNPRGLGISSAVNKGIPKLAKIGKPDIYGICPFSNRLLETELTNPRGLGISGAVNKGIPKLAKIGKPDIV